MKVAIGIVIGLVGAYVATTIEPYNRYYSRYIYDCGVSIGSGVHDLEITKVTIEGHRYGVCVDSGTNIAVNNAEVNP